MPYLTPDSPPSDTICRTIVIPNDVSWISLVNGALSELFKAYNFEQFGDLTPEETAAYFLDIYLNFHESVCFVYPENALHFHENSDVIAGNNIAFQSNTSAPHNGTWFQSAAAQNDTFQFTIFAKAGDYTLHTFGIKGATHGIVTWKVNGGATYTQDWYASVGALAEGLVFDMSFAEDGIQVIQGKMATKNASSSGYNFRVSTMFFRRQT